MELIKDTISRFIYLFGREPDFIITAPGRVNLIGEHTDYNNGYVLPVTIDRKMIAAVGNRDDGELNLHSIDLQSSVTARLSDLTYGSESLWSNYPKGVAYIYQKNGYAIRGANFCIRGNIPIAAGLSSSAALEVAATIAFKYLNHIDISVIELIKIAQAAETSFVGVQCGIMDQFVSVMGRINHALFLDCKSLEYSHIPYPTGITLVVCDSGIRRELARSAYNQRQAECAEAVQTLAKIFKGINSLRDITSEQFGIVQEKLSPVLRKRAWHVISENDRVLGSVEAMKKNDLSTLGKLMTESHESLRNYYDVSCRELDIFVEIANSTDGVYGARMTGAGFGGSAICLVAEDKVDSLVERIRSEYPKRVGRTLTLHLTSTSDGAAIMDLKKSSTLKNVAQLS